MEKNEQPKYPFSPNRDDDERNTGDICPQCGHNVSGQVTSGDSGYPDFIEGYVCPDCLSFSTEDEWDRTFE